jgi:AraC-like DNA-binding protein
VPVSDFMQIHDNCNRLVGKPILTGVGILFDENSWISKTHYHENSCELLFIKRGNGVFFSDGQETVFFEDSLIVVEPGLLHHEDYSDSQENPEIYFIRICGQIMENLPENSILPAGSYVLLNVENARNIVNMLFQNIYHECYMKKFGSNTAINSYMEALVLLVLRLFSEQTNLLNIPIDNTLGCLIKKTIDEHFRQNISLRDIAQSLHISQYHLSHVFKTQMEMTPCQYLAKIRVEEAKRLLSTSKVTINKIAKSVGMPNYNMFILHFKYYTNMTPSSYRRNILRQDHHYATLEGESGYDYKIIIKEPEELVSRL